MMADPFSGVLWQAKRDTAFPQGDKRSAAPSGRNASAASLRSLSSANRAVPRCACPRPVIRPGRDTPEAAASMAGVPLPRAFAASRETPHSDGEKASRKDPKTPREALMDRLAAEAVAAVNFPRGGPVVRQGG